MHKIAAIIGGGVIGGGWAARFLLNGWNINVFDPDPLAERKISEVLENARHALPMLYDRALPAEGELKFCNSIQEAVKQADWIQESVPERLNIKHKVFAEIQTYCEFDAIIGSSTSGFKPSDLQKNTFRPEQIIVTHPFNPVYLLPLIEVVSGPMGSSNLVEKVKGVLISIGFFPMHIKKEIDAHIADRFLEAVWREALWLIKDDIATTEEIDNAIRYGFGLRWAQMGLFETYRVAGGEKGMEHFIAQFGPCLSLPWTKLTDVPELTDELVQKISIQSNTQSGGRTIRELERLRDNNLVAIIRALKQQKSAVGLLIGAHEKIIQRMPSDDSKFLSVSRKIPADWTDYNGHMNEGYYGKVFSDAADEFLLIVGVDDRYIENGHSFFTVETKVKFIHEILAGQDVYVCSSLILADGKKVKLFHELLGENNVKLATCEQLMLHVNLKTRKSCRPLPEIQKLINEFARKYKEN